MNFAQSHKFQWKKGKLLLIQKDHSLGQPITKMEDNEIWERREGRTLSHISTIGHTKHLPHD